MRWGATLVALVALSSCWSSTEFVLNDNPGATVSPAGSWLETDVTSVPADNFNTATIQVYVKSKAGTTRAGQVVTLVSSRGSPDTIVEVSAKTNAAGVATFKVKSMLPGTPTLIASLGSTVISRTVSVTFVPAVPTQLVFSQQPSATLTAGGVLITQPKVNALDAFNNLVTTSTVPVSLALFSDAACTTAIPSTPSGAASLTGTTSVAASGGIASFSGIGATYAGAVYLQASSSGLAPACSQVITVAPAAFSLAQSVLTSSAATVASGSSVTLTLTARDTYGNGNPSGVTTVVINKASGAGNATYGAVANAGSGVYTSVLTGTVAGVVTSQATINGAAVTDTENVTVTAGTKTKLAFVTQPASTNVAGANLATQPVVAVQDASGNTVPSASDVVTLAAFSDASCTSAIATTPDGSATLGGTLAVAASSGVVSYSGLSANRAGPVYLQASASGLSSDCSALITVSPGAFSLADSTVTSSASSVNSGSSVTLTMTGKDAYGNTNPTGITTVVFSKQSGAGNGTYGSTTNAGSGVYTASFTGTTAGVVTNQATINGSAVTDTENVTVNPGTATQLAFTTQPSSTNVAGAALATQPVVQLRDASNNLVSGATDTVVLAAYSDATCTTAIATTPSGGATLGGTLSKAAVSGVASFTGISANRAGSVYIQASSGSLTTDCSALITVSPGAFSLAQSLVTSSAATVASGSAVTLTLTSADAYGNANPTGITTVVFSKQSGAGTGSYGSTTNAGSGVYTASFTGTLTGAVVNQATINGSAVTDTETVTVTMGAKTQLAFTTQPAATGMAGTLLSTQPRVSIQDANGNTVTSATDSVTLSLYGDSGCSTTPIATTFDNSTSLAGQVTQAASSGVYNPGDIRVYQAGTVYLKAAATGLTSTCSSAFTVAPNTMSLSKSTVDVSATTVASGNTITLTLTARDAYGNPTGTGVTSQSFSTSGTGTGTISSLTAGTTGVWTATFTGQLAGSCTITGVLSGSNTTNTKTVTVTAGAAAQLVFDTQPGDGPIGGALITQPVVRIADAGGNTVSSTANVTLSLASGTGALGGTVTKAAVGGVATFTGLTVSVEGAKTLGASATVGSAISGTSSSFRVVKVSHTSPAAMTVVHNGNVGSMSITGTCSEEGRTVAVTTVDAYGSTGWGGSATGGTCTGGVFTSNLPNLTGHDNGTLTVTVSLTSAGGATHSYTTTLDKQFVEMYVLAPKAGTYITPENASAFNVRGYCSHNGSAVNLNVGGVTANPVCTGNAFSADLNLSGVSNGAVALTAQFTDGTYWASAVNVSLTKQACSWNGSDIATAPVNSSCHTTVASNRPNAVYAQKTAVGSVPANTWFLGTPNGLSISTNSGSTWTTYTTAQGLPHNNINSITVASTGTICVATDGGLALSPDLGANWIKRTTANGLPSNHINDVIVVGTTVYVSTDQGVSISTDSGASWTNRTIGGDVSGLVVSGTKIYAVSGWGLYISTDLTGATFNNVSGYPALLSIATDGSKLYIGSRSQGLLVTTDMTGSSFNTYDWDENVPGGEISRIRINSSGHIFAAGEGGVAKSTNGGATWASVSSTRTMDVYINSSDEVVLASRLGFQISTNGGSSWTSHTSANVQNNYARAFYGSNSNRVVHADSKNHVYLVTGSMGEVRRASGGWGTTSPQDEFVSMSSDWGVTFSKIDVPWTCATHTSVKTDSVGRLYLGCHEGLYINRYGTNVWRPERTSAHGLGTTQVNGIALDSSDNVYVATNGGVSISTNKAVSFTNKTTANGLGSNTVRNVAVAPNGYLYAATANGLSISTDGGATWVNRTTADALATNDINDVAVDANRIYLATAAGVAVSGDLSGTTWSNRTTANGLGSNTVTGITVDSKGIYAATAGGLSIAYNLSGTGFTNKVALNGLGGSAAGAVAIAPSGRLFSTSSRWGGLQVFNTNKPSPATSLTWSQSSPQYQGAVNATWTKSSSGVLNNQYIQYYSDGSCGTTYGSETNLSSSSIQTHALSVTSPGTYTYRIKSVGNNSEYQWSSCSAAMQIKKVFYQGIAFGGDTSSRVIAGNTWIRMSDAVSAGLSFTTPYTVGDTNGISTDGYGNPMSVVPAAGGDLLQVLYNHVWRSAGDLGFTYPLASGTYRFYFYSHENYMSNYRAANIVIEGTTVGTSALYQSVGQWQRWGPYDVSVTDGTLNVLLQRLSGDATLSGLEIYKINPTNGTSLVADNFNSGISGAQWNQWSPSGLYAVSSTGRVAVTPPGSTTPNGAYDNVYGGIYLSSALSLYDRTMSLELVQKLNNSGYDETFFGIKNDSSNQIYFYISGTNFDVYKKVAGTTTHHGTVTYNSATHRYMRMRHDSLTDWVYFEFSPDKVNWTQMTKFQAPFAIYGVPDIGAGVWSSVASPGTAIFDNFDFFQN